MSTHTLTRNGQEITVDLSRLSDEIKHQLMLHGLTQKIGDSAANSAKIAVDMKLPQGDVARNLMEKTREALYNGDWGVTRGEGVSEETSITRAVVRKLLKKQLSKEAFAELTDEKVDSIAAKNAEKLKPMIADERKRREEIRKLKAKATAIEVEINF